MKAILSICLFASLALLGCQPAPSKGAAETTEKNDSQVKNVVVAVSGTIYRTADYCGGAAPPQELLDELATPKPYAGIPVHVRKGGTNDVGTEVFLSATTDDQGRFTFLLAPGTWCVILDEKGPNAPRDISGEHVQVDEDCYKAWLSRCDEVVEVKRGASYDLKINYHERCHLSTYSNCATWIGPLPPSPPPMRDE